MGTKYGFMLMELHVSCLMCCVVKAELQYMFLQYSMYVHICIDKHMNDGGIYMNSQWNILKS